MSNSHWKWTVSLEPYKMPRKQVLEFKKLPCRPHMSSCRNVTPRCDAVSVVSTIPKAVLLLTGLKTRNLLILMSSQCESIPSRQDLRQPAMELQQMLWKDTRLLLGMCLESRARYRASKGNLGDAEHDLGRALSICRQVKGEADPQTLVLMNDLATFFDLHGRHDDALTIFLQAVDLGRASSYSDLHMLLGNTAALLLHTGRLEESVRFYQEALVLSRQAKDQTAVAHFEDGLKEVMKRRSQQSKEEATNG